MKAEFTVNIKKTFTKEDIIDLIDMAIQGGIGYWACLDNRGEEWDVKKPYSEITFDLLNSGEEVTFWDAEEDYDTPWKLTMKKLLKGIEFAIADGWSGELHEADANTADNIFQYALFNEIVFS